MSEFKFGSGSTLRIRVRVVWIFESFRVRTHSDIGQLNLGVIFGLNSLEILSK